MKLKVLGSLGLAMLVVAAQAAFGQGNPRGTSKIALSGKDVSVEYGRPSLKGRSVEDMLNSLKPGAVWRLGADTSTTFSTATDLVFGDATVPAGEYSLWAQKEADGGWKLVFNKQHGQWGTQHDAAQDLVAVPLKQTKAAKSAEMVTIDLAEAEGGGALNIQWGDMSLTTNFKAK
jgi:hypothetical protein